MSFYQHLLVAAASLPLILSLPSSLPGQDVQPTAAEQYGAVRDQFNSIGAQLDALAEKYREAPPTEREEIRQSYSRLVERMNELLPQLAATGTAAYKQAPNADGELVRLLVGLVANDLRSDRYEQAAELAKLLIDNKCPELAIYGLAGSAAYCMDDFDLAEAYLQKAKEADVLDPMGQMYLTDVGLAKKLYAKEQELRKQEAAAAGTPQQLPRVLLKTTKGDITVELYENEAPQTVGNFISLVEQGFYDGLTFHRVLPNFMAQGGCPDGTGAGGPGYQIYCECGKPEHRNHFRGTLSMAHAGKDTGGSQFFLTFRRTSHLDGVHTVFGRVVEGLDVLAKLQRIDPQSPGAKPEPDKIVKATVIRKRDHKYKPTKVQH